MVKPSPCRVVAKPASRSSRPATESSYLAELPTLQIPVKPLDLTALPPAAPPAVPRRPPPPPPAASGSVPGLWTHTEVLAQLRAVEEPVRESMVPMQSSWLPRRKTVLGALAMFVGLVVVFGVGGGAVVRAVPEAAAARPVVTVTGASCSDARPASAAATTPVAPVAAPVVAVPAATSKNMDLGDLDPPVATATPAVATPVVVAPVASAKRPTTAKPVAPPAAPRRAAPSAAPAQANADVLFAGRL